MTENPQFDKVKQFNIAGGHAVRDTPSLDHEDIPLRLADVFLEEVVEIVQSYISYLMYRTGMCSDLEEQEKYIGLVTETTGRVRRVLGELVDALHIPEETMEDLRGNLLPEQARPEGGKEALKEMVLFLDGLADTEVVLNGLAQATGMPITEAFDIANDSNMSKFGPNGERFYHPEGHPKAGKVAKGPDFWDPKEKFRELLLSKMQDPEDA